MAKRDAVIKINGKFDDEVFVNNKYGRHIRKAPKKGTKKNEPALKEQYNRTGFLNTLAGDLNKVIGAYAGPLKPTNFYQVLQQHFRKEPVNNRFLLLKQLEGMEVNPKYALNKLGDARVTVLTTAKTITVNLHILFHPSRYVGRYKADCYTYEVSLLCWKKGNGASFHARQFSEWISLKDGLPDFDFGFTRPAGTVHWLVCLKQQLGINEEPVPTFRAEGMMIMSAWTSDKKDLALLAKKEEEESAKAEKAATKKVQEQIVRVKAKAKRQL
ncbi:hypothetical protein [Niastella populi]|uniref:Uncharacterized protein n=1 Tax=Niastella populi TaxID=550983 RepID=A0A1V9G4Y3_9BACT|nr:hypothetical protein [Niastella populi]OQP65701.1 hypothetical protein A4R26_14845 [Niastella populi]